MLAAIAVATKAVYVEKICGVQVIVDPPCPSDAIVAPTGASVENVTNPDPVKRVPAVAAPPPPPAVPFRVQVDPDIDPVKLLLKLIVVALPC